MTKMKPLELSWEGTRPCPQCGDVVAMDGRDWTRVICTCGHSVTQEEWDAPWPGCWWAVQLSCFLNHEGKWSYLRRAALVRGEMREPYRFPTKEDAERMLDMCYPDLCREDRLDPKSPRRTRVVPVPGPKPFQPIPEQKKVKT